MAYTRFATTVPASSQTGSAFATSANANDTATLDMLMAGLADGYAYSQSGGTAEEPTTVLMKNGTRWFKAALTWTGGNITGATFSLSTNSGGAYDTIGSAATFTYDGSGNLTASTNFGGLEAKVAFEWIGKVKALRADYLAHEAATGTAVHGLGTMSTQANTAVDINGGSIDGTPIGASAPAAIGYTVARGSIASLGSMTGTVNIDWSASEYFYGTVTANTTITFSNLPNGVVGAVTLELTNPGAFTITWPTIKWPGRSAPARTASGVDIMEFHCRDGATVRGAMAEKDSG